MFDTHNVCVYHYRWVSGKYLSVFRMNNWGSLSDRAASYTVGFLHTLELFFFFLLLYFFLIEG